MRDYSIETKLLNKSTNGFQYEFSLHLKKVNMSQVDLIYRRKFDFADKDIFGSMSDSSKDVYIKKMLTSFKAQLEKLVSAYLRPLTTTIMAATPYLPTHKTELEKKLKGINKKIENKEKEIQQSQNSSDEQKKTREKSALEKEKEKCINAIKTYPKAMKKAFDTFCENKILPKANDINGKLKEKYLKSIHSGMQSDANEQFDAGIDAGRGTAYAVTLGLFSGVTGNPVAYIPGFVASFLGIVKALEKLAASRKKFSAAAEKELDTGIQKIEKAIGTYVNLETLDKKLNLEIEKLREKNNNIEIISNNINNKSNKEVQDALKGNSQLRASAQKFLKAKQRMKFNVKSLQDNQCTEIINTLSNAKAMLEEVRNQVKEDTNIVSQNATNTAGIADDVSAISRGIAGLLNS
ncbi:hypothetical protein [Roseibium sp. RKSG952]|uniref:hypothetical protein n=1 Tax=Roseibium sp. RKSG952 TaxID=2529384 RepID=UPI0012BC800C|nr:hypothetical protein [Roseibium sp. RKSG952]MTH97811.1 hypothetical protein [Roseibium sp. RKSG952]